MYPDLDREQQSEQLPHLTPSFRLIVVGRVWVAEAATTILDPERAMPSSVRTEKTAPRSEAPGHGGRNTDI